MFWKKKTTITVLEFIGGPLDGHQQATESDEPTAVLAFPVSKNLFHLLHRVPMGTNTPVTSVAFYEIVGLDDGIYRYNFIGTAPPEQAATFANDL